MSKKLAVALTVVLLALVAWALLLESNSFSIVVNGQPVTGPLKGTIGAAGVVAALIAGFAGPLLVPLAILWLFVAIAEKASPSQ